MLKKKFRLLLITSLTIAILIPTQISLVYSSAGAIRINRTTASIPNQQVNAGDNVNLYFGDQGIMWSGNEFYLLLSHDLSTTSFFRRLYLFTQVFSSKPAKPVHNNRLLER